MENCRITIHETEKELDVSVGSVEAKPFSPRAHKGLFVFCSPKALRVVSRVKMSVEFEYAGLIKIHSDSFPQIEFLSGYPIISRERISFRKRSERTL